MIFDVVTNKLFKALLDGTAKVGKAKDAEQLGGKGASEHALAQQIKDNSIWNELTEGFDLNNALGKYRTASGAIIKTLLNLPSAWTSGELSVEYTPFNTANNYGVQTLIYKSSANISVYQRAKKSSEWGDWLAPFATTADIANKLDKTGGELSGYLYSKINGQGYASFAGSANRAYFEAWSEDKTQRRQIMLKNPIAGESDTDCLILYSSSSGKEYPLLHSGNVGSYALLLTSDTTQKLTGKSNVPLAVRNSNGNDKSLINFFGTESLGYLGFNAKDSAVFVMSDGATNHTLHHDGNSAKVVFTQDSTTAPAADALWAHL